MTTVLVDSLILVPWYLSTFLAGLPFFCEPLQRCRACVNFAHCTRRIHTWHVSLSLSPHLSSKSRTAKTAPLTPPSSSLICTTDPPRHYNTDVGVTRKASSKCTSTMRSRLLSPLFFVFVFAFPVASHSRLVVPPLSPHGADALSCTMLPPGSCFALAGTGKSPSALRVQALRS